MQNSDNLGQALQKIGSSEGLSRIGVGAGIGAATGALGPAGGAALRAAAIGRRGSRIAAANLGGKARALTDAAADLALQPAAGAILAASNGDNAGIGALTSLTGSSLAAAQDLIGEKDAPLNGPSAGVLKGSIRGTLASGVKQISSTIVTGLSSLAVSKGTEVILNNDDETGENCNSDSSKKC